MAQAGARKRRREAVFEVRLGAQLGEFPFGELAVEEQTEALAKDQSSAAAPEFRAGVPSQVHQKELALALAEPLDREAQPRPGILVDRGDPPGQVARTVPGLQGKPGAAHVEREVFGGDGEQFFAGFEQGRLPAVLEETLNSRASLLGGRHGNRIVARFQGRTPAAQTGSPGQDRIDKRRAV